MMKCNQIKIGAKIKCISPSHYSYGKAGTVVDVSKSYLDFRLDENGELKVCYDGCFAIISNNHYNLLNGGQGI